MLPPVINEPPDAGFDANVAFVAFVAFVAKATDWLAMLEDVMNDPPDCGLVAVAALPVVFWFSVGNEQLAKLPDAGVPKAGDTKVGLLDSTTLPEPVDVVTPVPPLATGKVPVVPPSIGSPVTLVITPLAGVPSAGVTSVGLVANTKAPVPVSSVTAVRKLAELGVPKKAATPAPKAVRPVPPEAAASGEVSVRLGRWSFWKLKLVPSDHTVTVLPAGMTAPVPAAVVLPSTVELKSVAA